MNKYLKITGTIFGLLILVIIAAVIIVPRVVNPNQYKGQITQLVKAQTGRDLRIIGDIRLSMFPGLAVEVGEVEMGNAAGFTESVFARFGEIKVGVRLLPLLSKRLEAGVLTVRGLAVNLERASDGQTNWEDLVKPGPAQKSEGNPGASRIGGFAIAGLEIRDAAVTWNDRVAGQQIAVSNIAIDTTAMTPVDPVSVTLGFDIHSVQPDVKGPVSLGFRLIPDLTRHIFQVDNLTLSADLKGKAIPGERITVKGTGAVAVDVNAQRLSLEDVTVKADGLSFPPYTAAMVLEASGSGDLAAQVFELAALKIVSTLIGGEDKIVAELSGNVQANLKSRKVSVGNAALNVPELSVKGTRARLSGQAAAAADLSAGTVAVDDLKISGTVSGQALPGGEMPLSLGGRIRADLQKQTAAIESLRLEAAEIKIGGEVSGDRLFDQPKVSGSLSVARFNLRDLLARFKTDLPPTADPKVLGPVEADLDFSATTDSLKLEKLSAKLDDTRLNGFVHITDFADPAYEFNLTIDAIDADRYLQPTREGKKPAAGSPGTAAAAFPVDTVQKLKLDGKLAIGKLKIANLKLQNIVLQAAARDGLVTAHPVSAALYGGTYNGNIRIDARGQQPVLGLDEKLASVQAGPLLKDLQGQALLSGATRAGLKITATGADADTITRSLNGSVDFGLTDGAIEGVDILGKICRAVSAFSAGSLKKEDLVSGVLQRVLPPAGVTAEQASASRTEFSEMRGSMVFAGGIGTSDDLQIKSPLLRVDGAGTLDLPGKGLDYQVTARLVKSCEGQGGKTFRELANYPIPVRISGPLDNLEVKPDLTAGLVEILLRPKTDQPPASSPAKAAPGQTKQAVEDTVKDALQKGLQDLFKKP